MGEFPWVPVIVGLVVFLMSAFGLAVLPAWQFTRKQRLAVAASNEKDWPATEVLARKALAATSSLGKERLTGAYGMGVLLCRALQGQRRYKEAEAEARKMLEIAPAAGTDAERAGLALTWLVLGDVLLDQGRLDAAETAVREAEALQVSGHEGVAVLHLAVRTDIARRRGQYREAIARAEALQVAAPVTGPLKSVVHAEFLHGERGLEEAKAVLLAAEKGSAEWFTALHCVGYILGKLNRLEEATRLQRMELEWLDEHGSDDDLAEAYPLMNLTSTLARLGQAQEAGEMLARAEQYADRLKGNERSVLFFGRGIVQAVTGNLSGAEAALRESIRLDEAWTRVGHPATVDGLSALALVVDASGREEEADEIRERVGAIQREFAELV